MDSKTQEALERLEATAKGFGASQMNKDLVTLRKALEQADAAKGVKPGDLKKLTTLATQTATANGQLLVLLTQIAGEPGGAAAPPSSKSAGGVDSGGGPKPRPGKTTDPGRITVPEAAHAHFG